MLISDQVINISGIAALLTILWLTFTLVFKMSRVKELQATVDNLKKSLDEMDEQAKLIVRTDMELNKTQEELDKKITGLYALQEFSRIISSTLEEKQIFSMVKPAYLEDIGFEKTCAFLWDKTEQNFTHQLNIGYLEEEIRIIKSFLDLDKDMYLDLIKSQKVISTISASTDTIFKERLSNIFKASNFVISPILPKEGDKGFLFVGTDNNDIALTEGDEELVAIFSNQIGQALENARLFEKIWRSQQELERKVDERTHALQVVLNEVKIISKRKTDFISAVSHELRTPLTSIKGYASILLAGRLGDLPEDIRLKLAKINQHSDELTHLVNDLLDISRIESGRMTMRQEHQDLKNTITSVSDLLFVQLKDKRISLLVNIPEDARHVFVDASQIKRVFINLIGNALKFTPADGKISITSQKIKYQIQVDVADTGCGIPEESQQAVFEEFYRVDNFINQQVKGTGLGLTLVKHIIEAHGGKIWVSSKLSEGTTFSFTLPMV